MGIAANAGSFASRLYIRSVEWPSAAVPNGCTSSSTLEPADGVAQFGHERRLDGVLDDRVALGVDPLDVLVDCGSRASLQSCEDPPMELDNPAWYALRGPQATVAEGGPLAFRYRPDVAVFAALPDDPTPEAWDALRDLVGPGGVAFSCGTP